MADRRIKRVRPTLTEEGGRMKVTFSLPGVKRSGTKVSLEGRRIRVEGKGRGVEYQGVRVLPRLPGAVFLRVREGEVEALSLDEWDPFSEIERLQGERDELKRRLQALQRDLEILRKRSEDERERLIQENTSRVALRIIEVLDNIERALLSGGEGEGLREGIEILRRQVERILNSMGIKEIEAEGEALNPLYHHAVKTVVDPSREEDTVVEVLQKGYIMGDRVIRPAMVVVSKREGGDDDGKGAGD